MPLRGRRLDLDAEARWNRRSDALEQGTKLMSDKPNPEEWTNEDRRLWRYALAVQRRLEKIH
jgi:hypothetical protein